MSGSYTPEQLQRLYDVSRAIHATLEPAEALKLIVREAVTLMGATSGSLALVNPTTGLLEIEASEGLPDDADLLSLRPNEGITGWVAHHGEPLRIGDVSTDERYISARAEVRSELAVPLFIEDTVRAVLNVDAELLRSLVSVGQTINRNLHVDEVLESVTREAAGLDRVKMSSLQLLDPSGEWLEVRAQFGAGTDYQQRPPLSVVESLMGAVVRRRKPMQVLNVQTSAQYQHPETARREGLVSLLCAPLVFGSQNLGTLSVYTEAPHVFSNEEVRTLSALAELSAVAIEKARLYERTVDVEEQLRRNEQLSALGLLAAEVAHEIRNPLTVMKMLYHSMELDFAEGDPRAEDARVLGEKMNHLDRIVDNIVKFARNAEPQMGPVDLPGLLDDLALLTRHKLQHQQIHLVREDAPDLPPVKGDATQLSQAFLNLILNAAEAMQQGGTLQIATKVTEQGVTVAFTDSGSGMTEEQRERAFTGMLSTTKEKGGGLGLAIVAKVAEAHGGRVEVQSAPGEGTRIQFRLSR